MLLWPQDVLLNLAMRSSKSSSLLECKRYFRNIASPQTFLAHLWETQYDTAPSWPIPIWPLISFLVFLNIQLSTRCLPWMSSQLKFNFQNTIHHNSFPVLLLFGNVITWQKRQDKPFIIEFPFPKMVHELFIFLIFFLFFYGLVASLHLRPSPSQPQILRFTFLPLNHSSRKSILLTLHSWVSWEVSSETEFRMQFLKE